MTLMLWHQRISIFFQELYQRKKLLCRALKMCLSICSLDTIECVYEIILNMKYQRRTDVPTFFFNDCVAFLPFISMATKERDRKARRERGG